MYTSSDRFLYCTREVELGPRKRCTHDIMMYMVLSASIGGILHCVDGVSVLDMIW